MFLDPTQFPFVDALTPLWRSLRAEAEALLPEHWFDWEDPGSFTGSWQIAPLFTAVTEGIPMTHTIEAIPRVAARCPVTSGALATIPGLTDACFSRLGSGAHIHAHEDHEGFAGSVRGHLALLVPGLCRLRAGDAVTHWTEGEWLFFDGSRQHEAANECASDRIVLLIDLDRRAYPDAIRPR